MWNESVGPKISPFAHASVSTTAGLLKLGERLTLTCAIVKGDLPLIISWTLDGRPVVSSPGTGPVAAVPSSQQQLAIKAVQIDPYTSLLSIDSLRPVHSGNYTCNVRHPELPGPPVSQSQLVLIQGTSEFTHHSHLLFPSSTWCCYCSLHALHCTAKMIILKHQIK